MRHLGQSGSSSTGITAKAAEIKPEQSVNNLLPTPGNSRIPSELGARRTKKIANVHQPVKRRLLVRVQPEATFHWY